MLAVLRWVGFVLGLALVVATWRSIVTTVILPRRVTSPITEGTWRAVHGLFLFIANRRRRYASKDRLLALLGPIAVLAALVSWIILLLIGYGLMLWPLAGGSLGFAVRLAGSSVFTLGSLSSAKGGASVLEFIAAASGLVVVALQIGYLPVLYGAY